MPRSFCNTKPPTKLDPESPTLKVLEILKREFHKNQKMPTAGFVAKEMGWKWSNSINHSLARLHRHGYLKKDLTKRNLMERYSIVEDSQ